MINLVEYAYNRCLNCLSIDCLYYYKGNKLIKEYGSQLYNNEDVDRLVCSKCGKEYAIDLSNKERIPEPLDNNLELIKFTKKFTGDSN